MLAGILRAFPFMRKPWTHDLSFSRPAGEVDVAKGIDRTKTLQQLEGQDWGECTFDSQLVATCHRLRQKPLDEFTVEDLRILIGQKISLPYLIPIALEQLEVDPLVAGDYYAGDLLAMVLLVDDAFWINRQDLFQRIRLVVRRLKETFSSLDSTEQQIVQRVLCDANCSLTE